MSQDTITENKEVDCPHCKNKFDLEIQRKKPKVTIIEEEKTIKDEIHTNHTHNPDPHEELAKNLPKGWNFATCKDGNCGTIVKNPKGLVTDFKTCPNCKDNSNKKTAKICKTCGKKPEDGEEWDESDIDLKIEEDEYE